MSNYRLVKPNNNNIFYKSLAAISTAGIIVITGIEVSTAMKKGNATEDQFAQLMVELKTSRQEALGEVKTFRSQVLKDWNVFKTQTFTELKSQNESTLKKIEQSQQMLLAEVKTVQEELSKELRELKCFNEE